MTTKTFNAKIFSAPGQNRSAAREYALAILLTVLVTAASLLIEPVAGHAAVSSSFLLLVVVTGLKFNRGPVLCVAIGSAFAWYIVFIPPRFAFHIGTVEDAMVFASFFAVAVAMGHLTSRLRLKEIAERTREKRTAALYELVKQAGLAHELDSGLGAAIGLTEATFGASASLLLRTSDGDLAAEAHPGSSFRPNEKERAAAAQALMSCKPVGKFTDVLPGLEAIHLPLRVRDEAMGVLSIRPSSGIILNSAERGLLEAFAMLIGSVLDKDQLLQAAKRAEILRASERLQRALLQSVSHELKTPLAAVQAGIEVLTKQTGMAARATIFEIQGALRRLHRVINNLLDMTRIESGVISIKLDWCDVGDLVQAALDLAGDGIADHRVVFALDGNLPMVRVDQGLLEQCLCNLLLNAASNSPEETKIFVRARVAERCLTLSVRDEGKGISEADLPRVFEPFYRTVEAKPGGIGLGLAIVDGFSRAHGGRVSAINQQPGVEIVLTLPVEILEAHMAEKLA